MKRRYNNRKKRVDALAGHLFLLPANLLLFVFVILPILLSLLLSFVKYNGFGMIEWAGIKNYIDAFHDPDFGASMRNTLVYVVVTVPIQTVISLAIAAILAAKFRNAFG